MKILNLALDNSALDKTSALAKRFVEYGELVEMYTVILPSQNSGIETLSHSVKVYGSGGGNKLWQFFKLYNRAKKLLRQEKYDVITVQDPYYLALLGLKLARRFSAGLEIQVHGWEKNHGMRKLIARAVLPKANAVRCVSQRLKKQLASEFKVAEQRITVVPIFSESGIRTPSFAKASAGGQESGIREKHDKFIFLTVGRLVEVKNIAMQIEAMRTLAKQHPDAELWIIGDGPELNNLKFKILNLKLEKSITLLGRQKNLEDYYRQAGAFLLTSNSEGWGLAVIEAAGFGLPIIMTDVGCAGEAIKNDQSGLVIPVGDIRALEQAMEKVIGDNNLRAKLAVGAKAAAEQLPTKKQTLELYKLSWQKAIDKA